MKIYIQIAAIFWVNACFAAPEIVSSFTVLDYWAGKLSPNGLSHKSLIASGEELHGHQMSPVDSHTLSGAKLILGLNPQTEPWLADWAKANSREAELVWVNPDPSHQHTHAWLNPVSAKAMIRLLAANITTKLHTPAEESQVLLVKLLKEVDDTSLEVKKLVELVPEDRRKIILHHPNLESFADFFKIKVSAAILDSAVAESADPSIQHYSEVLNIIKVQNVRVIAYDEGQNSRIAEQLASDSNLPPPISLSFEYLQPQGKDGDTWPSMMLLNTRKIVEALKK